MTSDATTIGEGRGGSELPDARPPANKHWDEMLEQPARSVSDLSVADIPAAPGVYLWRHHGRIAYVGTASSLVNRLWKRHLAGGKSLGSSSLRRNVAEFLLGIPTTETLRGRRRLALAEVDAVRSWLRDCDLSWQVTASPAEAAMLEQELRRVWMPPLNRI